MRSVQDFEDEYLHFLETKHSDVLRTIRSGQLPDEVVQTLEQVARDIAAKYEKKTDS